MFTPATANNCPRRTSSFDPIIISPQYYSENGSSSILTSKSFTYKDDGIVVPPLKSLYDSLTSAKPGTLDFTIFGAAMESSAIAYLINVKFVGRWECLVDSIVPANTDSTGTLQNTKTRSFMVEDSHTVSHEFGIEIKAGVDVGMVSFESTLSAKFDESFTHSTIFCYVDSTLINIPSFTPKQDTNVACWQRIGSFQFVYKARSATEWIPFGKPVDNTANVSRWDIFPPAPAH